MGLAQALRRSNGRQTRRGSGGSIRFATVAHELDERPLPTGALIAMFRCAPPARSAFVAERRVVAGAGGRETLSQSSGAVWLCGCHKTGSRTRRFMTILRREWLRKG
jgi:hypothetical protein